MSLTMIIEPDVVQHPAQEEAEQVAAPADGCAEKAAELVSKLLDVYKKRAGPMFHLPACPRRGGGAKRNFRRVVQEERKKNYFDLFCYLGFIGFYFRRARSRSPAPAHIIADWMICCFLSGRS